MSPEEESAFKAIGAVIACAELNWPRGGDIRIATNGSNDASVLVPHHVLTKLLSRINDK